MTDLVLSSEVDRRAAVIVIHGSDEKVALESFAEWIRSGRRIGYEKISRVSDAIAKARQEGKDEGLEQASEILDMDAAKYQNAGSEAPLPEDPGFWQFYMDEFARQCASDNAEKIRAQKSPP